MSPASLYFVKCFFGEKKCCKYTTYSLDTQSEVYVIPDKSQVYYNFNGAQRNYQNASDRHLLYGSFVETIKADMISLHTENEGGCCRMS